MRFRRVPPSTKIRPAKRHVALSTRRRGAPHDGDAALSRRRAAALSRPTTLRRAAPPDGAPLQFDRETCGDFSSMDSDPDAQRREAVEQQLREMTFEERNRLRVEQVSRAARSARSFGRDDDARGTV